MADWIAEIDRIEAELVAAGVPPSDAMRVSALFADALAKADAAKRKAQQAAEADKLLPLGAALAAERIGCCKATVYNRAQRFRKSKQSAAG